MNIVIIEDEIKTANALGQLIGKVEPTARIVAQWQSVEQSVQFLQQNPAPDLLFMDIQLSDGLCFDIFHQVNVNSPVIFCTASDDYVREAFKANGIDYILKPFAIEDIREAINKVRRLENFFQSRLEGALHAERWIQGIGPVGKKAFLIFHAQRYQSVETENIAYFQVRNEMTMIATFKGQNLPLDMSLDDVQRQLDERQFFRLNRQYLVNFKAIDFVKHDLSRKLSVHLKIAGQDEQDPLMVGKDKAGAFLKWLSER